MLNMFWCRMDNIFTIMRVSLTVPYCKYIRLGSDLIWLEFVSWYAYGKSWTHETFHFLFFLQIIMSWIEQVRKWNGCGEEYSNILVHFFVDLLPGHCIMSTDCPQRHLHYDKVIFSILRFVLCCVSFCSVLFQLVATHKLLMSAIAITRNLDV